MYKTRAWEKKETQKSGLKGNLIIQLPGNIADILLAEVPSSKFWCGERVRPPEVMIITFASLLWTGIMKF